MRTKTYQSPPPDKVALHLAFAMSRSAYQPSTKGPIVCGSPWHSFREDVKTSVLPDSDLKLKPFPQYLHTQTAHC